VGFVILAPGDEDQDTGIFALTGCGELESGNLLKKRHMLELS
jgi:hypothetical protein